MERVGCMMLAILLSVSLWAQEMEVNGRVFDEQKQPVIGATIRVKSTGDGTVSDMDGKYRIKTEKGDTLVFLFIGYVTREIEVREERLDVYLKPDLMRLEEVTVVAFGSQKREYIVGSFAERIIRVNDRSHRPPMFPPFRQEINTEEYEAFSENRFLTAAQTPLSTFSLDVDAASYGNIRRLINQGELPPKEAVRVEEMINYFSYSYPHPTDGHPVRIITEVAASPWNKQTQLIRIGVKAKEIPSEALPASNFVFLIDVSGSMSGADKLPLVKASMKLLVNNLRPKDRVAIVTYAGAAGEALPSTSGSDRQKIMEALDNLQAGGSTAGGAGIQLAYKIAEKNLVKGGNNRVILCTDGDFNVGVSSVDGLETLIEQKRQSGVYLTVLGYGMGNYKEDKLQTLAQKGNGNHAYIDNLQEANKVLVHEFGSTMVTVARDVKLQVEFNPHFVSAYRLIGYETRLLADEDFNDDTKDAGELGPGHTVTALYEIVPMGVEIPVGKVDKLKYQQQKRDSSQPVYSDTKELLTVKLRYKEPDEEISKKLEVPVLAPKANLSTSSDFHFVMAVAMFGQLLRDSTFKGDASYAKVIELARKGLDDDPNGYRREFIRLAEAVEQLEM
ncbi:MAG: von Willebrand factor type A domain-containing protein [Proteiniphilum sp.]|nr:von Willebrand factor type A domain-containing protein [Proteiniphilum sp.]